SDWTSKTYQPRARPSRICRFVLLGDGLFPLYAAASQPPIVAYRPDTRGHSQVLRLREYRAGNLPTTNGAQTPGRPGYGGEVFDGRLAGRGRGRRPAHGDGARARY